MDSHTPQLADLLADSPTNWGRWGPDDEVGALNHLDRTHVRASLSEVRSGHVVTLQRMIGAPGGDPIHPTRDQTTVTPVVTEKEWRENRRPPVPGGARYADDKIQMHLQASTQYDALGHVWHDGLLWNGFDSESTIGGLSKASIEPIAKRGVVGRAVLIDFPRHFGTDALAAGHRLHLTDILDAAAEQDVEIRPKDILILRTNYLSRFYADPEQFWEEFDEPGLTYSSQLVGWFHDMSIPNLVTDTIANETLPDPATGAQLILHNALMRNLGVAFTELCDLEDLAHACEHVQRWSFLYVAAPLLIRGAAGSPVNPVALL